MIENVYTLKITNMDDEPRQYVMSVLNNDAVEIDLARPLDLAAEETVGISVRLRIPRSAGQGVQNLTVELKARDDESIRKEINVKAMLPIKFGE
jgi:uncharacterized protein YfaS (alpha-2-macroglobulin family)